MIPIVLSSLALVVALVAVVMGWLAIKCADGIPRTGHNDHLDRYRY
jgi:hypothetical protein